MDTNILSCAKCGHTLSETAETCAYCGAVVSSADSPPQPDAEAPDQTAQPVETPPLPADESPPVLDMTDEFATTPAESGEKSEAEPSSQRQSAEARRIITESAADAVPVAEDPPSEADDPIDFQLPDDELIVDFGADEAAKDPESPSDGDAVSAGTENLELEPDPSSGKDEVVDLGQHAAEVLAEVVPLADKVTAKEAVEDSPGLPQTPVLEVSGEDSSESETLGADILELVADEAPESEPTQDQHESAVETTPEAPPDLTPDGSGPQDEELEAILLPSDDEVQSETPSSREITEGAGKTEAPEKIVELASPVAGIAAKSEASSVPGEAQKKHKAAAEAKLLEKQKSALSKAKALKIKKLKLAKAQALKRKKLALVKAQALKKQKEAQTGSENPNPETAAGSTGTKSMQANTKMLGLLKKYEGQAIGINYDNSADIKEAELVEANDEFIRVFVKDQKLSYSHPLKTILTIIEGQDGVATGTSEQKARFKAVVKVYPLVLF
jgi:hypothetical protein